MVLNRDKMGEGLQYNVYRLGDERVLKKPKSPLNIYNSLKLYFTSGKDLSEVFRSENRDKSVEALSNGDLPVEDLFRVREVRDNGDVVQDYLTPVEDELEKGRDFEQVVNDFIDLLHEMWSYGVSDCVYNFTINNGYDGDELVMMDFGELVFEYDTVLESIEKKKWLGQWSYNQLSSERQQIFRDKMNEEITVNKLDETWRSEIEEVN